MNTAIRLPRSHPAAFAVPRPWCSSPPTHLRGNIGSSMKAPARSGTLTLGFAIAFIPVSNASGLVVTLAFFQPRHGFLERAFPDARSVRRKLRRASWSRGGRDRRFHQSLPRSCRTAVKRAGNGGHGLTTPEDAAIGRHRPSYKATTPSARGHPVASRQPRRPTTRDRRGSKAPPTWLGHRSRSRAGDACAIPRDRRCGNAIRR